MSTNKTFERGDRVTLKGVLIGGIDVRQVFRIDSVSTKPEYKGHRALVRYSLVAVPMLGIVSHRTTCEVSGDDLAIVTDAQPTEA